MTPREELLAEIRQRANRPFSVFNIDHIAAARLDRIALLKIIDDQAAALQQLQNSIQQVRDGLIGGES